MTQNGQLEEPPIIDSLRSEKHRLRFARRLLLAKATNGFRSPHFWIIVALFAMFGYVYYGVLESLHDVYLILFFYPLLYTAIVFRQRGVIIGGAAFLAIVLPYTLIISDDALVLIRSLLFVGFALLVSTLWATLLNHLEQQLEAYEEIVSLNQEMNGYIERLKNAQQQLIQAAKLSYLGQLAASVAHELNNPLGGIMVYTKLLEKKLSEGSADTGKDSLATLEKIESAVEYCSGIIRGLLDFARQSPPVLRPVTLSRTVDKVVSLVGHQAKMNNVEVVREDDPSLPLVVADFNQLLQVLVNLTVNAIQAMPKGGRLTIHSFPTEDGWVKISFEDTGVGISQENMEKLFTPFFTTKEEVKGVGLGLAVSHGIIERHGGRIEVESEVGKGSTFTVYLPVHE